MSNVRHKEVVLVGRLVPEFFSEECQFCGAKKFQKLNMFGNALSCPFGNAEFKLTY